MRCQRVLEATVRSWPLYQFLRAAVTKNHEVSGLKQQKFILIVLEAGSLKSRCWQAVLLLKALGENLASSSFWRPQALHHSNLPLHLHMAIFSVSLCVLSTSHKDTSHWI